MRPSLKMFSLFLFPSVVQAGLDSESSGGEKTNHLQQKSKELRERLMVSEATVQAQAEQLKDYRQLLSEWKQ